MAELRPLNPSQQKVVDTLYGTVLVIAGPGTGKTEIIARRALKLLQIPGVTPENILITTFTEAGVASIKKRLLEYAGSASYKITVSTIHAFSNDIILTYGEYFLPFKAKRKIDDLEQLQLFETLIAQTKLKYLSSDYDALFYLRDIAGTIGKLKQEAIDTQALQKATDELAYEYASALSEIKPTLKKYETERLKQEKHIGKLRELAVLYQKYQAELQRRGLYDYADMITFTIAALKANEPLRRELAERYQFVMVDEFQDTNSAQNTLVETLLADTENPNLLAVGDDDQSIYRFQGANLENLFEFSNRFPDAAFLVLNDNYRARPNLVELSSESIAHNSSRISAFIPSIEKKLTSTKTEDGILEAFAFSDDLQEKIFVAEEIRKLQEKGGFREVGFGGESLKNEGICAKTEHRSETYVISTVSEERSA